MKLTERLPKWANIAFMILLVIIVMILLVIIYGI